MPLRAGLLALLFMATCYTGKAFITENGVLHKYHIQKANFDVNDDPFFKSKEEAEAYKRKHNIKGQIKRQYDGTYAIENKREHFSISKDKDTGKVTKAALAAAPRNGMTNVFLAPERREPYTGLSGKITYIWTGGNENGIHYNKDGYPLGPAPKSGAGAIELIGNGPTTALRLLPGLKITGREHKLMQHARDWYELSKGMNATKAQLNMLKKLVRHVHKNATFIKQGIWRGGISDAIFYSNGKHIVVTQADGTLITILKNAHSRNRWFLEATSIK